jgi:hypothetical protein
MTISGYKSRVSTWNNGDTWDIATWGNSKLTPNGRSPIFGKFLKFGQAIVNAIFVQKMDFVL